MPNTPAMAIKPIVASVLLHFSAWSVLNTEPCRPVWALGQRTRGSCGKTIVCRCSETIASWSLHFEKNV